MNNTFDVIVIGGGTAGLTSALSLQKLGYHVLLLEKGRNPGGGATTFKRGRFTFDTSPFEIVGNITNIFRELGLENEVSFKTNNQALNFYVQETKHHYIFPVGEDAFIEKMAEYIPNSNKYMERILSLAKECHEANQFLESHGNVSIDYISTTYPNFTKYASLNVTKGFKVLGIPKNIRNLLMPNCFYYASPSFKFSFVFYLAHLYERIIYGSQKPLETSWDITLILAHEFEKLGGVLERFKEVNEIQKEEDNFKVITNMKEAYFAKHLISNVAPEFIYGKLINPSTKEMKQLVNSRVLGPRPLFIFLGLNESLENLKLGEESFFVFDTLNSKKEYQKMKETYHPDLLVSVTHHDGETTTLVLASFIYGDDFDQRIYKEKYQDLKNKIASYYIDCFERTTGISIYDHIEEIEVATPVTFARYTGQPDGTIYGYLATDLDNTLPRLLNEEEEVLVPNLRFTGAFGTFLADSYHMYLDGKRVANQTKEDMKHE